MAACMWAGIGLIGAAGIVWAIIVEEDGKPMGFWPIAALYTSMSLFIAGPVWAAETLRLFGLYGRGSMPRWRDLARQRRDNGEGSSPEGYRSR